MLPIVAALQAYARLATTTTLKLGSGVPTNETLLLQVVVGVDTPLTGPYWPTPGE